MCKGTNKKGINAIKSEDLTDYMYKHIFSVFLTGNVTPQSKELIEMS